MKIRNIYISREHNFFGHAGKPAGEAPAIELEQAECVAGKGILGDRFFGYKTDYRGQITFFEFGWYQKLCEHFGISHLPPSGFRRNVITEDIDLNTLIGVEFEVQGVKFLGTEECKPCYWLDQVFGAGTEKFLEGHGGLRARILTDGFIRVDPQ